MPTYEKHFTLEEARAWLPQLRLYFARIHTLFVELTELQSQFLKTQRIIQMNGHAPKTPPLEGAAAELKTILKTIHEAGIEVKDIERGLVDFPHWRNDDEVFLCWEMSEDDINFWHFIEDGFPGRQPL
jgi:hypothetical protein